MLLNDKKLAATNAPLLRQKEQAQLEIMARENKCSISSEKKSQSAIEESRHLSRALRAMKGNCRQGVEKVTITKNGSTWECHDRHSMERALFTEGHCHFSQTQFDPPMDRNLTNDIGFWGQRQGANDILHGACDVSKTPDIHMQLLPKALQMPQSVIQVGTTSPEISPQEHHME